ncbi:hypothetical protein, partial [Desulfovibrio sp. JC022]|uniref:hypothetical protein n=1 Tax=Desulfovibrio sp. JC022 TaxID=2593642 RepID=UPI0013D48444
NNANYAQGSAQATTDLNQSGARKGQAVADSANALAAKQAQVTAKEQEKQTRRDNAAADKRNAQRRAAIEATSGWSSPLTDTVDQKQQPTSKPGTPNATAQDKDEGGFWDTMEEIYDAAGKAVDRTIDVFKGDEKNSMKFAGYVSDDVKGKYNAMMKGGRKRGVSFAFDGSKKYGPAGLALAMVGTPIGMVEGLMGEVIDQNKSKNVAAKKAEEHFLDQRSKVKSDYFDKFRSRYGK